MKNIIGLINDYRYVLFESVNNVYEKKLLYSAQIKNELMGSLFGRDFESDKEIVLDQIVYGTLTEDEMIVLSKVGCFQFDLSNDIPAIHKELYEYLSTLGTSEICCIDVPSNVVNVYLHSESMIGLDVNPGFKIEFSNRSNGNKLLILTRSPIQLQTLSQDIHNSLDKPHNNISKLILVYKDLNSLEWRDIISSDLRDNVSGVKLADYIQSYQLQEIKFADNRNVHSFKDYVSNDLIYTINNKSYII